MFIIFGYTGCLLLRTAFLSLWQVGATLVVCGPLVAVASLVAEHRLQSSRALVGFVVRGLGYPVACGIFPEQGLNPCSLH